MGRWINILSIGNGVFFLILIFLESRVGAKIDQKFGTFIMILNLYT